jgi:methylmalonyl-CoA/ethylmalonyl-CoA epimerase
MSVRPPSGATCRRPEGGLLGTSRPCAKTSSGQWPQRRKDLMDEPGRPDVLSKTELSNSFLGSLTEICFVTRDHRRTMQGLVQLGIGPWRVYTFDSSTVTDGTYHQQPADYGIKVCFATVGGLALEIMEPLYGPSIFQEHLDRQGEGVQHLAFDCQQLPWAERQAAFLDHGFGEVQSGNFAGSNRFAFFDTLEATGTTFETYDIPGAFVWPEPDEWYPAAPPPPSTD